MISPPATLQSTINLIISHFYNIKNHIMIYNQSIKIILTEKVFLMGIKTFETRNSLKSKLRNRNLLFNEKERAHS